VTAGPKRIRSGVGLTRMRFMELQAKGRGKTPQQRVRLSRSVLRIAGDGHVEGAGDGGSNPTNVRAIGAHEREETGTAARRTAAAASRAPPCLSESRTAPALDAPNRSSLMPADA
jgi:hypothetical protein